MENDHKPAEKPTLQHDAGQQSITFDTLESQAYGRARRIDIPPAVALTIARKVGRFLAPAIGGAA